MRSKVVKITPKLAAEWLKKNKNNRRIKARVVDNYGRDMIAGNWRENGESIKFDKDGLLEDGQHRLMAIVKYEVTISSLVVFELDPDVRITLDTGSKRSHADHLRMTGYADSPTLSTALRLLWKEDHGTLEWPHQQAGTNSELSEILKENPKIVDAVNYIMSLDKIRYIMPKSVACYCLYVLSRKMNGKLDQTKAMEFFDKLNSGMGVVGPIHHLRDCLLTANQKERSRLPQPHVISTVFRGWNAWVEDRKISRINLPRRLKDGKNKINIPVPVLVKANS